MKVYSGRRVVAGDAARRDVTVVVQHVLSHGADGRGLTGEPNLGRARPLTHIAYHSPDGFEWGYAGSGPADLALAVLADHFEEPPDLVRAALSSLWASRSKAATLHQQLKQRFFAGEPGDEWKLRSDEIDVWLQTPVIRERLAELAREDAELAEIRRMDDAESADAGPSH